MADPGKDDSMIAFIGAGNIARAIIGGLVEGGHDPARVIAADPSSAQLEKLPAGVSTTHDANAAVIGAKAVILCVKPNLVVDVAGSLAQQVGDTLVVSVAAGVTTRAITAALTPDQPVIRCMPNTPALVQTGMTALFATPSVSGEQRSLAESIMGAVGKTYWCRDEAEIDAVTAVSGSGPAYFFLVMEAMEAAGIELGLTRETARMLIVQTAMGAATMAANSSDDPVTLRRNVTSPGGTTEAAVNTLIDGGLPDVFRRALTAAYQRSIELAGST